MEVDFCPILLHVTKCFSWVCGGKMGILGVKWVKDMVD